MHVLPHPQPKPIDVHVVTHHMQRYAVWFGGSMLASTVSITAHVPSCFSLHTIRPFPQTGRQHSTITFAFSWLKFSCNSCFPSQHVSVASWYCDSSWNNFVILSFFAPAAGVLPSVPHQEGLRRDRAEHLPPQPRLRCDVVGCLWGPGGGGRRRWSGRTFWNPRPPTRTFQLEKQQTSQTRPFKSKTI